MKTIVTKWLCSILLPLSALLHSSLAGEPLPYSESFENGLGIWTDSMGMDITWSNNTGRTVSSYTGPALAHEGSHYLYTESSIPNYPSKSAGIEATFDLSNAPRPAISFFYHMYGAAMGTLYLDVHDGSTWHTNIFSQIGQLQRSEIDLWKKGEVDLTPYAGGSDVTLRFRGVTGTSYTSDIALDLVQVIPNAPPPPLYFEGFESGLGIWTPIASGDFEWVTEGIDTLSRNTGPDRAAEDFGYAYMEASGLNYPQKTAGMEASIDLSSLSIPQLSFKYYMYGRNMGTLYVDVYTGTWHTNIWSISGEQHTSTTDTWSTATIDLSPYGPGANAKIRLRGITGDGYRSDIAVDSITIGEGPPPSTQSYQAWILQQNVPANQQGYFDDPAADGMPNIWKYTAGLPAMTPANKSTLYTYGVDLQKNQFYFSYRKSKRIENTTLQLEWSTDLTSNNWKTNGLPQTLLDDQVTYEVWGVDLPTTNQCFLRLLLEHQ